MRYILLTILIVAVSYNGNAQNFSTTQAMDIDLFMMSVKNIDEFIERFNDDTSSYSLKDYKSWLSEQVKEKLKSQNASGKYDSVFTLISSRPQLLRSLFNWENKVLSDNRDLPLFFNSIVDSERPKYIQARSPEWYAETKCYFTYQDKKVEIPIILHVRSGKGRKWMISGIGDSPVFRQDSVLVVASDTIKPVINSSIPFTNSALNFPEFVKIFNSSLNQHNYFESELLGTERGKKFVYLIKQEKLKHLYVGQMRFHFYQIPGWAFIVDQITTDVKNSSWLINDVKQVKDEDKNKIKQLLHQREL